MSDAVRPSATGNGVRRARPEDAARCAAILNRWIDDRDWMPRVHTEAEVEAFYHDVVFARREVWVIGDPAAGFMALDREADVVTALYVAGPGRGLGRRLLNHAKAGRATLELWTFVANKGARRFYAREGFTEIRRTEGDNEEGLPDVLLRWERDR
ncbi:GNAT family N-acetyltransferase [Ovoidimarina sediminis]|uniref:GNAT family N-acetyltransferase n=1 Tax=Ovoidimarina sediminis TaxID=3079856 RepID=UPI002931B0EE|nr:GNAT family N-acetyltransferase [Rhodophyticola sp. MJ-SS7]